MVRNRKTKTALVLLSILVAIVQLYLADDKFSLTSGLNLLVSILVLWIFLPVVRFVEYVKSNNTEAHGGGGTRGARIVLSALTIGQALCFARNMADEAYLQPDTGFVIVIVLLWLAIPLINFLIGMRTVNRKSLRMSLVIAAYYFFWMLLYALNGSTRSEMGAEHMHVIFAPFVMVMCSPIVLYGEFCLRRFEAWLSLRRVPGEDTG